MDEILIEEKRYISSKRAAKITGYAKDYIGQLCREGKVPARLVGRSWYVLETAIQDHRFGNQEITQEKPTETPVLTQYEEAFPVEVLPTMNRSQEEEIESSTEDDSEGIKISDSWKEWFNRVAEAESVVPVVKKTEMTEDEVLEDKEVRSVYIQPPHELLPHSNQFALESLSENKELKQPSVRQYKHASSRTAVKVLRIGGVLLAVTIMTLAVIGSGYLDKYIISVSPVNIIAGVALYNK